MLYINDNNENKFFFKLFNITLLQNIVNSSTLTASGQVVGTAAKVNFPQPIMPASKAIIQNRPGFAASNQAIIGTVVILLDHFLH